MKTTILTALSVLLGATVLAAPPKVEAALRRRGIGRLLVAAVRRWAVARGCVEFASDCHADNETNILFHRRLGFDIAERLVHFRQAIPHALIP